MVETQVLPTKNPNGISAPAQRNGKGNDAGPPREVEIKSRIYTPEEIKAPRSHQVVVVLDANVLIDLSEQFNITDEKSGAINTNLLKKALGIPAIGKIVVPEYVLDFETKGIARKYITNERQWDRSVRSKIRPFQAERIDTLLHGAVRRHVDSIGKTNFLVDSKIPPEEVNKDIIIWETQTGREMTMDMLNIVYDKSYGNKDKAYGRPDRVADQNAGKNIVMDKYSNKSLGELCIEEFTDKEIPWKNPVLIVTNDTTHFDTAGLKDVTHLGQPKLYMTTRGFIESMIQGGVHLADELKLTGKTPRTQTVELYNRIRTKQEKSLIRDDSPPILRGTRALINRHPMLAALIPDGVEINPLIAGPSVEAAPSDPAVNGQAANIQTPNGTGNGATSAPGSPFKANRHTLSDMAEGGLASFSDRIARRRLQTDHELG